MGLFPTEAQKKQGNAVMAVGWLILLALLVVFGVTSYAAQRVSFWKVLGHLWIINMTWNVVDLLIVDWLIVCTIRPNVIVPSGTEHCAGWKDYGFHFKLCFTQSLTDSPHAQVGKILLGADTRSASKLFIQCRSAHTHDLRQHLDGIDFCIVAVQVFAGSLNDVLMSRTLRYALRFLFLADEFIQYAEKLTQHTQILLRLRAIPNAHKALKPPGKISTVPWKQRDQFPQALVF